MMAETLTEQRIWQADCPVCGYRNLALAAAGTLYNHGPKSNPCPASRRTLEVGAAIAAIIAENRPPEAVDEPQTPPVLLPHVWLQNAIPDSPPVLAGQVMTSDGRPAGYVRGRNVGWLPVPVRFAPRTQEGLDQLFDQLLADANRAQKGAA